MQRPIDFAVWTAASETIEPGHARTARLANFLGVSRWTVWRSEKRLAEHGLVIPTILGRPRKPDWALRRGARTSRAERFKPETVSAPTAPHKARPLEVLRQEQIRAELGVAESFAPFQKEAVRTIRKIRTLWAKCSEAEAGHSIRGFLAFSESIGLVESPTSYRRARFCFAHAAEQPKIQACKMPWRCAVHKDNLRDWLLAELEREQQAEPVEAVDNSSPEYLERLTIASRAARGRGT